uniref:Uncharacterized protein n=1 Tax=Octactis speculum TaxID=3111310 RepID=A0A7S2GEI3_9STRA|mmetsp:Transcript_434/g.568  ORF Transcript_434/g.568 Transcript_434/m.568 type:complete len:139 (+) Transcript_434:123-539(+)
MGTNHPCSGEGRAAKETVVKLRTNITPCDSWPDAITSWRKENKLGGRHPITQKRADATHTGLSVPFLKSILQKNIRRGFSAAAARVSFELACVDWSQLIRRLVVIMVEDSVPHPAAPLLVWLLLADSRSMKSSHTHNE